jgi:NAD dependent epimerase/dehydratase family enzyme
VEDLCRMFIYALEQQQLEGEFNAVAPRPVTNEQLTRSAAQTLHKPLFMPNVPGFAIRLAFGEMASIVLGGNRVSCKEIEKKGFSFQYPHIDSALKDLLS